MSKTKDLEAAVKALRLYMGSEGFTSVKDQQRLYRRASQQIEKLSAKYGFDRADAWEAISKEAKSRGGIRPAVAKDI